MQNYRESQTESVLDGLYFVHMDCAVKESETMLLLRRELNDRIQHLPFREQDAICCATNAMCCEQERTAFLDGICTGAKLILELLRQ